MRFYTAIGHRIAGAAAIFTFPQAAALVVFLLTYVAVAIGRFPGLRLDRAGAALVGASLMVASVAIPLEDAFRAIDFNTITLLLGMMIVVANLRLSGFFGVVTGAVARTAKTPLILLAAVVFTAGALSAFLVNDTICLMMTPLVLDVVLRLERTPVPYLLAIAMAANIGSVATVTGNPQNMIVASLSGISYGGFAAALTPVALGGLVLTIVLIALFHPSEFLKGARLVPPSPDTGPRSRANRVIMVKTLAVVAAMTAGFLAGIEPAEVAIAGGAVLLLTRRVKPKRVYAEIDWTLLLMFSGLFIVVQGMERNLMSPELLSCAGSLGLERVGALTAATAVLSNLVSNVPAVLVLKPLVATFADPRKAWLLIAMASTLAGNLTLLGSVANLIVAERARSRGVQLSFFAYLRVGLPLTLITLLLGAFWLA